MINGCYKYCNSHFVDTNEKKYRNEDKYMIHKFKAKGLNILLDVNSGGVHLIDDVTYDLLDHAQPPFEEECPTKYIDALKTDYSEEEIKESYADIVALYHDKLLFSEDIYGDFANTAVESPIKAMCLHIAHDCNLRCKYCFASTGDFGTGRKLMPLEVGIAAIDFLLEHSIGRENLEVDFFGGEPLMNFEVVKEIVKYARSKEEEYHKNFRFTITTNGMLLTDDKIDYINEEMSNVVLSIDGRKEVNDRMRVKVDGSGCYDRIVDNYKKLVEKRGDKEYYVRGTYTKYNLDFSEDVMHLYNAGFDQVSVEPVMEDESVEYAITEKDLDQIYAEYDKLVDQIAEIKDNGGSINFFHFMIDLDQGPCVIKCILYFKVYTLHWCVDGIHRNHTDRKLVILILVSAHIASALGNGQLHVKFAVCTAIQMCNHYFRIQNLYIRIALNISCGYNTFALEINISNLRLVRVAVVLN